MKKFISGLIIGMLITVSMSVFASEEFSINTNPFPIHINGQAENIESYNINGSTYIKLSDIPKATKNILEVRFDQENKTININTEKKAEDNISLQSTEGEEKVSEGVILEKDGLKILELNDKEYIYYQSISDKHSEIGWSFISDTKSLVLNVESANNKIMPTIESVPYITYKDRTYIEYDYYINTILPLFK